MNKFTGFIYYSIFKYFTPFSFHISLISTIKCDGSSIFQLVNAIDGVLKKQMKQSDERTKMFLF